MAKYFVDYNSLDKKEKQEYIDLSEAQRILDMIKIFEDFLL